MILERKSKVNIPDLQEQYGQIINQLTSTDLSVSLINFAKLMQVYNSAMKEVSTKLEILDDDFHVNHRYNPIHHLECRLKGPKSIYEKLINLGIEPSLEATIEHILDIAGIRVICNYYDDIYIVEKLLLDQSDVKLVCRKDYIKCPKKNGYRSLHVVVKVPVFMAAKIDETPVEIQFRTIAMDYWASLEHELKYKNSKNMHKYSENLLDCANRLADTEKLMQDIRKNMEDCPDL